MALHSTEFTISGVNTANTVLWNLKTTSGKPITVLEVGVFFAVLSSAAYEVALIRMNAVGTGAITSSAGAPHSGQSGDASTAVLETAWATARPTRTGSRFRRGVIPLSLGAGYIWQLGPNGIIVPTSSGLCFEGVSASGTTTGTLSGYAMWDE